MSEERSSSTGKVYGVMRVCRAARLPRSSYYARKDRADHPCPQRKQGPKPELDDGMLLEQIRKDLAESPFKGEGHRKVWARLKFAKGTRVSRKRVLRLMREHRLLSPHRQSQGQPKIHDGKIITDAPNILWGADGTKVFTLEEGYGWVFTAIEHWNAECLGIHVTKLGNRFAALEPIAQGVLAQFGSVAGDSARGLALRTDHGSQYTSDHFQDQIKAWGIKPSFAFLKEPETNGVAERFFRTFKEQVVYGRTFRNHEELRQAALEFVQRYNREWRVEKNGFRTPHEMRVLYAAQKAA